MAGGKAPEARGEKMGEAEVRVRREARKMGAESCMAVVV